VPPDGEVLDAVIGELLAALALDRGPILTVSLPAGLPFGDVAALVDQLAARSGPSTSRSLFVGDGVAFFGVGEALALRDPDAIAATVAAVPGRRLVVTLPFAAASSSSSLASPWARQRTRVAHAPRIWLHHRDGEGVLGVDLGHDDLAARREARALLERWRVSSAPSMSSMSSMSSASSLQPEDGVTTQPDETGHRAAVASALDQIAAGRLQKVVLARRRRLRLRGVAGDLPLALWRSSPVSSSHELRFLLDMGGDAFVGVTPERLLRRRGRRLEVDVLAGTAALDDARLLEDDKERREHEAVRRFVVDTLKPVAARLDAPTTPGLRRLRQLQHLYTPVVAELVDDRVDGPPVFLRLHPTPAVAGTPRDVAVSAIEGLEGFDRGVYAGAVGVVDADGEDLRVALRCAHLVVDDIGADVDLYVGSGIVAGSDAGREWQELERKEATMRAALDAVLGRP
jgi:isochorismate synthase